ncbi:hypothetical protein E2C01_003806 [Portunus trituberculatus]|uniref:Uncharacterized protein n=1 Tax=Portunus trituberculatus TaxID=210409 RepID=A0A5B7CPP2_PORTR|nr:hypothetical protein [Portunus trituberculatus]
MTRHGEVIRMEGPVVEELPVMRSMSPSTVFGEHIEIDFSQTLIKDPSQTVKITPSETSFPPSENNTSKKRKKKSERPMRRRVASLVTPRTDQWRASLYPAKCGAQPDSGGDCVL